MGKCLSRCSPRNEAGPLAFYYDDQWPDAIKSRPSQICRDLTISETVPKFGHSIIQDSVSNIQRWSDNNLFRLHNDKCKELRIDFKKNNSIFPPIYVNGKPLEVVEEAKLLGLTITSDLKWNKHVSNIVSKCSKRLYLLVQLKRAKVPKKDIIQFYTTCIRPVLEYASAVFHFSLRITWVKIYNVSKNALTQSYIQSLGTNIHLSKVAYCHSTSERCKHGLNYLNKY